MGNYIDPEAAATGTRATSSDGRGGQPSIPSGAKLYAVLDNGLYKAAPDVTDRKEYDYFYGLYSQGQYLSMKCYLHIGVPATAREGKEATE